MLYEYKCDNCGIIINQWHGMNEKPEFICEKCKKPLRRNFTVTPVVFKGTGWSKSGQMDDSMMKSVHPAAYKAHKEGKI